MTNLTELAEAVEGASGPDHETDFAIARRLGWTEHSDEADPVYVGRISTWWAEPGCEWSTTSHPPAFTASLDCAMSLVPEGWWVQHLGQCVGGWHCRVETQGISIPNSTTMPVVKTAALALCAAALRARAAMEAERG